MTDPTANATEREKLIATITKIVDSSVEGEQEPAIAEMADAILSAGYRLAPATESGRETARQLCDDLAFEYNEECVDIAERALAAVRQAARARAFDDAAHIYSSLMSEAEKIEAIRALKDKP